MLAPQRLPLLPPPPSSPAPAAAHGRGHWGPAQRRRQRRSHLQSGGPRQKQQRQRGGLRTQPPQGRRHLRCRRLLAAQRLRWATRAHCRATAACLLRPVRPLAAAAAAPSYAAQPQQRPPRRHCCQQDAHGQGGGDAPETGAATLPVPVPRAAAAAREAEARQGCPSRCGSANASHPRPLLRCCCPPRHPPSVAWRTRGGQTGGPQQQRRPCQCPRGPLPTGRHPTLARCLRAARPQLPPASVHRR